MSCSVRSVLPMVQHNVGFDESSTAGRQAAAEHTPVSAAEEMRLLVMQGHEHA